jgi:hypothetical protein
MHEGGKAGQEFTKGIIKKNNSNARRVGTKKTEREFTKVEGRETMAANVGRR